MTVLPDTEDLILHLLRATITDATISPDMPADVISRLPYLTAHRIGGAARHGRLLDQALIDMQAWATTRRAARDLCARACLVLWDAYDRQTVTPYGHISLDSELSGPSELPSDVNGVWRFQATHQINIRP